MSWELLALAAGTLISEDLACVAAGALVASSQLEFLPAAGACFVGIVAGDLALYMGGRLLGRRLLRISMLRRRLGWRRMKQARSWLLKNGTAAVFVSRFIPGLRLPVYVAAGVLGVQPGTFVAYLAGAAAVWTPLLVGGTALLGRTFVEQAGNAIQGASAAAVVAAAAAYGLTHSARKLSQSNGKRRMLAFVRRWTHWEFWPAWAAYLPLIPYLLLLATKHRSLTLFTLANPGVPGGGLAGESKSEILGALQPSGVVARFLLLPAADSLPTRMNAAEEFMREQGLSFPVVLKPDIGERGNGVCIIASSAELHHNLGQVNRDMVLQEYVSGVEFGVFYYRHPTSSAGRILSITGKHFPSVTGDGRSTLEQLIVRDERASIIADVYLRRHADARSVIPAAGESVQLVDIGSHCRGAVFADERAILTLDMEQRFEKVSRCFSGFYMGRYDIRAMSVEALQRGEFRVLELNGVAGEPAHIYDPNVSLAEAYRTLALVWRLAFEIGAHHRSVGLRPSTPGELVGLLKRR